MTSMHTVSAVEHPADLPRAAEHRPLSLGSGPSSNPAPPHVVALRLAGADEAHVVRRLAALDDAPGLDGQVLLALIDGEAVAALSLRDERVVANPFVLTEAEVELLRLRAKHLLGRSARRRPRAILRGW